MWMNQENINSRRAEDCSHYCERHNEISGIDCEQATRSHNVARPRRERYQNLAPSGEAVQTVFVR